MAPRPQVAAGRIPNVEGLGLEAAGVQCSPGGVKVNDDLTTSNPDILAIGDVPWMSIWSSNLPRSSYDVGLVSPRFQQFSSVSLFYDDLA